MVKIFIQQHLHGRCCSRWAWANRSSA